MYYYEAMVLLQNADVKRNGDEVFKQVHAVIERHGGEVMFGKQWGERKLAYPIRKQKRATYYLLGFKGPQSLVSSVRQDWTLVEPIMRQLILRRSEAELEKLREAPVPGGSRPTGGRRPEGEAEETPAPAEEPAAEAPAEETPAPAGDEGSKTDGQPE